MSSLPTVTLPLNKPQMSATGRTTSTPASIPMIPASESPTMPMPTPPPGAGAAGANPPTAGATMEALDVLGLSAMPASREELRSHYRTLMKTFHPDVNPRGLEMSQRITAAYAYLLADE